MGKAAYIKLPKAGTNPRGVEMQGEAMRKLVTHPQTLKIPINWEKESSNFNTYKRWIELWEID